MTGMLDFKEMPYVRPDFEALRTAYEQTCDCLTNAGSYEEAKEAFFSLQTINEQVQTQASICSVRNTMDKTDDFYENEVKWIREAQAGLIPVYKRYQMALAACRFRPEFEAEFGPQLFRLVDAAIKTTDESIIPETIREGEVSQAYEKSSALATTCFRGETCNFYGLLRHMESTDRAERRESFHAWANLYASIAPQLDAQYDELVHLRTEMARKLGFEQYTELAYLNLSRFDYTKEDAARFRKQIREIVTPAVAEIRERQRVRLGVDHLRYYDEMLLFPEGNANPIGELETLVKKAQRMYREMSPETGEFFDFMVRYHLFDLETRPGKHMGGYMTSFPAYQAPFIFSNFNGTSADVEVLTHEAGHAFQGYIGMRSIPVSDLTSSTSEVNEIHSMTMEHFAYPWMGEFFGEKADQYITAHLIGGLAVIPYMACVDEFQHEVYANPQMNAMERRRLWRSIERTYMPWRDYEGESFLEEGGFWMQKQHIFLYPFYYIDYALAGMCAFQYYGRMKKNRGEAWQDYLRLCRAGGTKGYFDLLQEGRLLNPFHEGNVEKSVRHVIDEIMDRY